MCPSRTFGATSSTRTSGVPGVPRLEDLLPPASVRCLDEYVEQMYEEQMEMKVQGAQKLLRLCTEVDVLEQITEHSSLLGVLSRELRENAKRSYELAVAITGIFLILANFSCFHSALSKYQCGEITMRVLEYESKRRNVLKKDLEASQEQIVSQDSKVSGEKRAELQRQEDRCRALLDRQDHLLQICILVLRALSEDTVEELKLVKQKLCKRLTPLLSRQHEDLLWSTLSMIHKLSIFEQNKDQIMGELPRLVELLGHPASEVFSMALRTCYNFSFDAKGRAALTQSAVIPRLVYGVQNAGTRKVALKVLYHLTLDPPVRSAMISKHPTVPALAMQLARSKEQEPEAVALLVNLAADEAAACLLLAEESFVAVALRAIKHKQPTVLKVIRNIASHKASRSILLDVMGGDAWLLEMVKLIQTTADRHDVLVEALGILAGLDFPSPEVPWPELCEAGLLEVLPRLLMVGFAEDDVVLEAVMILSILALDTPCTALLRSSQVIGRLPDLLAKPDSDLLVQVLFLMRCLLMSDETRDAVLHSDAIGCVTDLLHSEVKDAALELLDVVVAVESLEPGTWTQRVQEAKFMLHNEEWLNGEPKESKEAKGRRKEEKRSPSMEASKRSTMSSTGPARWGDESREDKRSRRKHRGK
ncbi:unnamed protein product [Effrenium voratum]|nr:unnamed protein product [Effrenium voratum]|mmetsp:Transcript_55581/g.132927  ORF Transcript_55581/g.132927 Transcript_55581/m.132927 type:complete len:647 (+) Transcript_55581:134-2074(+)